MNKTGQIFTYTAKRGACFSLVGSFAVIAALEAGAWILLLLTLPLQIWLKGTLAGLDVLLLLMLILVFLLAPLWTYHRLTDEAFFFHYGFDRLTIPRSWLATARIIHERLPVTYSVRVKKDMQKQRLIATFAQQNQVLLSFKQEQPVPFRRKTIMVKSILLTIDQPSTFLADLHLPATGSEQTIPDMEEVSAETHENSPLFVRQIPAIAPTNKVTLRLHELTRRYGKVAAVTNLSIEVQAGEIYGFLGPNGAGKTTTLKMIVGLIAPDHGTVTLDGFDLHRQPEFAKAVLGYVPDRAILYERLTGREMLVFSALLRGITQKDARERSEELIKLIGLQEYADTICETYSFGTKRKLALAIALLHRPQVVILDEPFNGLDPRSARALKDLLLNLAAQGTTVLLSTHDLATVETLCHRLGIIFQGRLVSEGSLPDLLQNSGANSLEDLFLRVTEKPQAEVIG